MFYVMFDEGFVNMGLMKSVIIFLDGEKGILCYCGYLIEVLVVNCDFVEISYLLIYGEFFIVE